MVIYDGTYRWHEREKGQVKTIQKCILSCRLRIIDLNRSQPEVKHIRPFIVVAAETTQTPYKTTCAESLGKRICKDYNLNVRRTLWMEYSIKYPQKMLTAFFEPKYYSDNEVFYKIHWRPARPNELKVIRTFIPDLNSLPRDDDKK